MVKKFYNEEERKEYELALHIYISQQNLETVGNIRTIQINLIVMRCHNK